MRIAISPPGESDFPTYAHIPPVPGPADEYGNRRRKHEHNVAVFDWTGTRFVYRYPVSRRLYDLPTPERFEAGCARSATDAARPLPYLRKRRLRARDPMSGIRGI